MSKSPMVTNQPYISNKEGYSDMQVLRSGAGYYIGTMYTNVEADGTMWQEPGSRDSGYYATEQEAAEALRVYEALDDDTLADVLRAHP